MNTYRVPCNQILDVNSSVLKGALRRKSWHNRAECQLVILIFWAEAFIQQNIYGLYPSAKQCKNNPT